MMKTNIKIVLLIAVALLQVMVKAKDVQSIFETANTLYKNKQFELAEVRYLEVLKVDAKNAKANYNLGNTYFHLNQLPKAILYYEKAKKYASSDKNIEHNLKLANNKLFTKMEFSKEFFVTKWIKNLVYHKTSHNWSILFFIFLWLSIVLIVINFFKKNKLVFKSGWLLLLVACILGWFTYKSYQFENTHGYAIVIEEHAYYKSKPVETISAAVAIQAGTKVEIIDADKNWRKIKLPNDKIGWINRNSIQEI